MNDPRNQSRTADMIDGGWITPTLRGEHVALEPLSNAHTDALLEAAADGELWNLMYTSVPGPGRGAVEAYVATALAERDAGGSLPFVVRDRSGAIVGSTRYYDIDRNVPKLKIGYTWYAARVQRTGLNTEAKLLLLGHAFERLRCATVYFETSHLNSRSQAAIARLGAQRDGVLRGHMRHRDGGLRDTVVFSMLASEWPEAKLRLLEKLRKYEEGSENA